MKISKLLDVSECLDSDDHIFAYLSAVLEDKDINLLILAIEHIAKAKGLIVTANEQAVGGVL